MLYHIDTSERTAGGRAGTVYTLTGPAKSCLVEVWPSHGFNCLKWQVDGHDLLYAADEWEANAVPTRSGVPVLFPFPNRIRDGVFAGRSLPINDAQGKNAIHGFTPRSPWRVRGYGADGDGAWLHASFAVPDHVPRDSGEWPGEGELNLDYHLKRDRLRIDCRVHAASEFPFGLGFHPYFRLPGDEDVLRYVLHAPARNVWPLVDNLPTGDKAPVPDELNWNRPRMIGSTTLDAVYADLGALHEDPDGLILRATLGHADRAGRIEVWTTADFRESVLFVPPHRRAVCIEPYTCTTDAVNLHARGVDAGWKVLPTGSSWHGVVEFRWNASE